MKLASLALAALLVLPAHQAVAQRHHGSHVEIGDIDGGDVARPGPRHSVRDARAFITTTNDVAAFVLTGDVVALQLTDHTLREMRRDMDRDADHENHGVLASMIVSAVRGSVENLLRRSVEVPIDDLRSVDYRDGRLVMVTEDGDRVFEKAEVNGTDLMASFSPADARAFVREFRALKARTR
ncbi:MAG TPA: hypothetical protein VFJ16_05000 [Longimicrobium sp.]|nr:hypothetical protein [Longimicrobium sp.]